MNRIIKFCYYNFFYMLFWFFPVNKRKILLSSYYGKGYGDNIKYIAEKLLEYGDNIQIVWLIKSEVDGKFIPNTIKKCKYSSIEEIFHLATAGIWIDNCRKDFFHKKKEQLYIQTWHGGGAQKKCENDVKDQLVKSYLRMAIKDAKNVDLMVSESRFMSKLYYRSFWYNGPVYECGYPRNDILLNNVDKLKEKIRKFYSLSNDIEFVLYAPTFRNTDSLSAYNIDFYRLKSNLEKKFKKKYAILVRLHPNIAEVSKQIKYDGVDIINSTFYPDAQELLAASSILIGDYSSINYDFSLKRQPVFRYAVDFSDYAKERDLYFPLEYYPYPIARDNDELEKIIRDFDNDTYQKNLEKFFDELGTVFNSHSAEDIASLILHFIDSPLRKKEYLESNKAKFILK